MNFTAFAAVGVGAACGAWLRWGLGAWLNPLSAMVPLGTLVAKAEAYRTQWATGRAMTAGQARQIDSTQTNANAADQAKAMLRARREKGQGQ